MLITDPLFVTDTRRQAGFLISRFFGGKLQNLLVLGSYQKTERQTDGQTDRWKHRRTDGLTERQTNRQVH